MYKYTNKSLKKSISLLVACASLSASYSAYAVDYEVISGTFLMPTVSPGDLITDVLPADNANLPTGNGFFMEGVFDGTAFGQTGTCVGCGVIDTTATDSGLTTFPFFGSPVTSYFAATGVDLITHPGPTIDLTVGPGNTTDISSFYANWNGTEFNQGTDANSSNGPVSVADNGDDTYTLSWNSLIVGGAFDGKTGFWTLDICVSPCTPNEDASAGILIATQTGNPGLTRTVTQGDGNVTITSNITSPFTYSWASTSADILGTIVGDTTSQSLEFDPSGLTPGNYKVKVFARNTTITPNESSSNTIIIKVVADFGGLDLLDTDNDGVPNEYDLINDSTMLQTVDENNTNFIMQSSDGSLKMGRTAFCSGSLSTALTEQNIIDNGDDCVAVTNANDTPLTVTTGIGGYYDFEVDGLISGSTVDVVIPLNVSIPTVAAWRIYSVAKGWRSFVFDDKNFISSTKATSEGVCPSPTDTSWARNLNTGDNCIRLSIEDGGPNDNDGKADGIVRDPGSLSNFRGLEANSPASLSVGGLWWLLLTPVIFLTRRLKKFF